MIAALEKPVFRRRALPIDVETYHGMIEHGLVDQRVELLRGIIVEKMSKSPLHTEVTDILAEMLRDALPAFWVRMEQPLTFIDSDSEPEPDVAVVPGPRSAYRGGHPRTAHLVIEVAVSSEEIDREKGLLYAEAGIEEYWLVLAEQRLVEVHTAPVEGRWTRVERRTIEDTLAPAFAPTATIRLAQVFPALD